MINGDKEKISIKCISQQSGFTLVELLAVIALLSLMLFMGLPLIQSQYYAREL